MSMNELSDSRLLRLLNAQRIVDVLLDAAPDGVSRADIARITGLSKPTASTLMGDLEEAGLARVARFSPAGDRPGRPAAIYELVPDAGIVIGADIGATKTIVGIADLLGTVLAETQFSTGPNATVAVEDVAVAAQRLVTDVGETSRVEAACVGVPGVYRPDIDRVESAFNLGGFEDLAIREALTQRLDVNVIVDNDVNLAAVGESKTRDVDERSDFAVISIGTGIGMGLMVGGHLYSGGRGAAGEIGSFDLSGSGQQPATLEGLASAPAVQKAFGKAIEDGHPTTLASDADVPDIFDAAVAGDAAAGIALEQAATAMACAVANVCLILDPSLVVFAGGVGANPIFVDAVGRQLDGLVTDPPPLVASTLGRRATFLGAISNALRSTHGSLVVDRLGAN